jgi:hypothetical protein
MNPARLQHRAMEHRLDMSANSTSERQQPHPPSRLGTTTFANVTAGAGAGSAEGGRARYDLQQSIADAGRRRLGLGIGAQKWYGSARLDDGSGRARVEAIGTRAWAVDGQAQGKVGQYPLSLYASVARAAGSGETGDVPNMFNDAPRDRSAVAIASQIGILPTQGASLLLAYRTGDNGAESNHQDRSATVGALYHLHQNVQLQLNYTMRSGNAFTPRPADGNRLLTLMLAAGF